MSSSSESQLGRQRRRPATAEAGAANLAGLCSVGAAEAACAPPSRIGLGLGRDDDERFVHPVSNAMTEKELRIASRRDVGAALEIMAGLTQLGFSYGETILDRPSQQPLPPDRAPRLRKVDLSFVRPGDFLLQTTRPPKDDKDQSCRKQVPRTYSDLEQRLFDIWARYLPTCSRKLVTLHERLTPLLPHKFANRTWMEFRERDSAPYKSFAGAATPTSERRSAVFFLRLDDAWPGGPGLISAWGLDSTTTMIWNYRLRRDFAHLLHEPGFVLAEITNVGMPRDPGDMLWATTWPIEIILHERALNS